LAIFLSVAWLLVLGSGTAEYFHNLEHVREDAAIDAAERAAGRPIPHHPIHDEDNCEIHAQLHVPMLPVAWVPLLVFLGLLVAFLTMIQAALVEQRLPSRIDCRGPPYRCLSIG
jgi:hypothetical protein